MPAASTSAATPAPASSVWLKLGLAWLIPGGGHFALGRRGRAAIVFATVLVTFAIGLLMHGPMFSPGNAGDVLSRLIEWGGLIGDIANGLPYFVAVWFGYNPPDMPTHNVDYGSKLIVAAGLLNILAMVDAYEIASGEKD